MGLNTPVSFCEWLKLRRKALDMTQEELARKTGCSVAALRKIEAGDRRPSKQLAALLAKALEISDEEQATFIRVARAELNLERLGETSLVRARGSPDIASLRQIRQDLANENPLHALSHHIPSQATPLIGREREFAAMERLFSDPQCRLLTLTGIGGIGKTRLAIEFGLKVEQEFPGGVFYIPLAPVNSAEKIVPTIAEVLGYGFSGPADPKEQLVNHIASIIREDALFIFDNLEHLLIQNMGQDDRYSVVELTAELLQRLPKIKILGTSRERMNLHGEWTYELHGLSVPPASFAGDAEVYDSIALFMKSAQRMRADFEATADEEQSMIQITQMVEGVPLAIELAAAWVGILSCQEIAREIKANMDFLSTTIRDIPERHRSMRATFDHSWKLLAEEERQVLCQLSVFHGGFDRNAAEQISGATLPRLASLIDKSLVRRSDGGRFDLHEVIRQYAMSYLNEDACRYDAHTRHCKYYLHLVHGSEKALKSKAQQDTIRRLTGEIDNIRAAWTWAIDHNDINEVEQAARGFGWYFEITGLYREGIEQLDYLVQALKGGVENDQVCRLLGLTLLHQGLLYFRKGEFDTARGLYEVSSGLLRPTGDPVLLADALGILGTILHLQGEYLQSRNLLDEGLHFARISQERWFEAWGIYNLGYLESSLGHDEEGCEQMMTGLSMWRELGDPQAIALGLNFLVPTLNSLGKYEEAKTYMYESIGLCEQSKNHWGRGTAHRHLGLTCMAEGEFAEANFHLLKSLEIFGEFSVGWDIARSLTYLGDVSLLVGNGDEARAYYQDALRISIEANALPIAMDGLLGIATLEAQEGRAGKALVLCAYVLRHACSEEHTKSRSEKLCEKLEGRLSPAQIEVARSKAQNMNLEAIVMEAMETM
jgi:predicted ATPase/DNA-binding XRE family transcriptional regulator